jgi:ATP-dependent DNA helicase RecG
MTYLFSEEAAETNMAYPLFHPENPEPPPLLLSVAEFHTAFPGEGSHIEFKSGMSATRVQDAAVAFSNAEGGVYIIGVAPDGRIQGVEKPGETAKDIHQAFAHVRNSGRYEVHELVVGPATVLVLAIARRHEGFAQTSGGVVLMRKGASNVALLGDDLSRFLARRSFQRFEITPTTVKLDDACEPLLRRLANAFGWPSEQSELIERLKEEDFAVSAHGDTVLTVAGALLLLDDPRRLGGRPYIDLRRYGVDDPDPDKTWKIGGSVDTQIETATQSILDELGVVSAIVGVQRVEMPKIPPRVIREAVANAVAHRSYESAGAAVRVDIYPTHIQVTSPGGLPEPVTLENLRYQQSARNDRLLGALRRLGLAEDLGKGIDRMQDDMADELLQPPEFSDDGSFFSVTLHLGGVVTNRERAWVRSLIHEGRLDAKAGIVVVAVARSGSVTNGDVRGLLGIDSVEARSILQGLVDAGVLVRRGQRAGSTYHIAPTLGVPARIRHTDDEVDEVIIDLASHGPITNEQVRQRTGLDRQAALVALKRLVSQGRLIQTGERRGTRYELAP